MGQFLTTLFLATVLWLAPATTIIHYAFDLPWLEALRWAAPPGFITLCYLGSCIAKDHQRETENSNGNGI